MRRMTVLAALLAAGECAAVGLSDGGEPLFVLSLCRGGGAGETVTVSASGARPETSEEDGATRLAYSWPSGAVERAVCTRKISEKDGVTRWGIAVTARDGWTLEKVAYPRFLFKPSQDAGEAALLGLTKGGLYRRPSRRPEGWQVSGQQPGSLCAEFACYYDTEGGFYTAAEDAEGAPKTVALRRVKDGLLLEWIRPCFETVTMTQAYPVATAAFKGDWCDAADVYKKWALGQRWCARRLGQREDLPAWMKDAPAMVRFSRGWLAQPDAIRDWLGRWSQAFPRTPLITAYWGWEKRGEWITPDYFPVFPSDEVFAALIKDSRALGCHAFPWPSGYHWTLTYSKRPDGTFVWDDRERFDGLAKPHAVVNRDGAMYIRVPSWLNGGNTACMCGGDAWTRRWWDNDVCLPLARLGCELIQVDQVVGGNFPPCFSASHGHPKGEGAWKTRVFAAQLESMRETMRKAEPDAVVCFEEPNEQFNHLVGLQDYRDCESPADEWASVYSYLYHEFVPPFQSNPRRADRVMIAHCLADGQMPHLVPSFSDNENGCVLNSGFEHAGAGQACAGWERVPGYNNAVWNGKAAHDTAEKHSGAASLRLDNAAGETVQVSQNISTDSDAFRVGNSYRLSAWLKTGKMAEPNSVRFGVFAPGLVGLAGGQLPFPAAGEGWKRVSADFRLPAGSEMIRVMIHIGGEAQAWADDFELSEVGPSGEAVALKPNGKSSVMRYMERWVRLYHGEGRAWLAFGKQIHPPALECARIQYGKRDFPAVFCNAFEAEDKSRAVALANATDAPQDVKLWWNGEERSLTVPANDALLERLSGSQL